VTHSVADSAQKSGRAGTVATVLLLLAVAGPIEAAAAGDQNGITRWIGTWAAAPQPFMPGALQTFRNQTVRLIVHTSVAGKRLRIRLSNTYGDRPLMVGGAHVARPVAGDG